MEVRTYPEFSTNYPLLLTTLMKRPAPAKVRIFRGSAEPRPVFVFPAEENPQVSPGCGPTYHS